MVKYISALIIFLVCAKVNGQKEVYHSLGIKPGFTKTTYYDETFNYEIYSKINFSPLRLQYFRSRDEHTWIFNINYSKATLDPKEEKADVQIDNIDVLIVGIDISYMKYVTHFGARAMFQAGAKLSSHGFGADRNFNKTSFHLGNLYQQSYEVTYGSLQALGQVYYVLTDNTGLSLETGFPFLALNCKNYNPKLSPGEHSVLLAGPGKYAGMGSELSYIAGFDHFTFELFYTFNYKTYKEPNLKKLLTSEIGIGLFYDF